MVQEPPGLAPNANKRIYAKAAVADKKKECGQQTQCESISGERKQFRRNAANRQNPAFF